MKNNDAKLLNDSLAFEQFAIAAYDVAADTGLLSENVAKTAKKFQAQHGQHAVKLRELIQKQGEEPVKALKKEDYIKQMPVSDLTDEAAIVHYASKLEKKAAIEFLKQVSLLEDRNLSQMAASISGDEAMHWAILREAEGVDPVPVSFIPLSDDEVAD